jgi:hypothetical protein
MNDKRQQARRPRRAATSELLILEDGRILAHNITPPMLEVLRILNREDAELVRRMRAARRDE